MKKIILEVWVTDVNAVETRQDCIRGIDKQGWGVNDSRIENLTEEEQAMAKEIYDEVDAVDYSVIEVTLATLVEWCTDADDIDFSEDDKVIFTDSDNSKGVWNGIWDWRDIEDDWALAKQLENILDRKLTPADDELIAVLTDLVSTYWENRK